MSKAVIDGVRLMARYVDPRFPEQMRMLRHARGLSLKGLYRVAHVSVSALSEYETGRRRPSAEMARTLDLALDAGGQLVAMVVEAPHATTAEEAGEAADRVAHATSAPRVIDARAVDALAAALAAHRRADDDADPVLLLPAVRAGQAQVQRLAAEARGPHAHALRVVAAEWTQFTGWLHAQARHDAEAVRLLTESANQAVELGVPNLACQAWGFRGYLERQRGVPARITRAFQTAAEVPGASRLHRVDAMLNTVHGLGLMGERRQALDLLGQANDMTTSASADEVDPASYWLTPTWLRIPMGMAYLGLDRASDAAENLRAGLEALPAGWQEAEWATEYRDALATAEAAA
ncbi:helix-turn-helix domain-containing protein [Promicromonospora soli]